MRKLHAVFHNGCNNLHYYYSTNSARVLYSPYLHQHLFCAVFLIIVLQTGVRWYLTVVFTCIFLMISDAEHLFMYHWPFVCLLWKNAYSGPLLIFKFWLFVFCYWVIWVPYIYLDICLLLDIRFANIFSHSTGCLFILLLVSFAVQNPFRLM